MEVNETRLLGTCRRLTTELKLRSRRLLTHLRVFLAPRGLGNNHRECPGIGPESKIYNNGSSAVSITLYDNFKILPYSSAMLSSRIKRPVRIMARH